MALNNVTILDDIWLNGTNDYQQRIPNATQSGIKSTMDALFDPMNKNYFNQFQDALVMRIGNDYVHNVQYKNPLSGFKKGKVTYGSTVQEMAVKWLKAHSYDDEAQDVFKVSKPETVNWFHSQNRRDRYDITINDNELRTAFTSEFGLNQLVAAMMAAPMNSDEYDEYRIMLQLLAEYNESFGFYKVNLTAAPTDEATGKEFLTKVKTYAGKLKFPSTVYNASAITDVPVFVRDPSELVLLETPETSASIDVNTLAGLFHTDKADVGSHVVIVDEFPIDSACQSILTTRDFFMCWDTEYRTTSAYNPKALCTNYFLHHWGIYSVSPLVPAIMFTTDTATSVSVVAQTVTGISATIDNATPDKGTDAEITVMLTGTLDPATHKAIKVAPDAATYEVTVKRGENAVNSPTTRVDEYGTLHVSNRLEYGDVITVVVTSAYTNPSGATTKYTATVTATVTAAA